MSAFVLSLQIRLANLVIHLIRLHSWIKFLSTMLPHFQMTKPLKIRPMLYKL